jgi:hypothetical protein
MEVFDRSTITFCPFELIIKYAQQVCIFPLLKEKFVSSRKGFAPFYSPFLFFFPTPAVLPRDLRHKDDQHDCDNEFRKSTVPLENFLGRRINYNIDLRIYFGMYCQVLVAETNNSLDQRTTGAVALTNQFN